MCTATDGSGNTGSNTTEMMMMGSGMYVQGSYYIRDREVANNSFILRGTSSTTCINVYCYSNSTSGGTGYFKLSDGVRQYSTSNYNYYRIGQLSNTGVSIARYSSSYYPQIFGIFTCEVPDSRGITVETSIGIYSSMPSPPSVYSISYSERHQSSNDGVLGTVDYLSQNSPPTNVTWTRDGSTIEVDGEGYEMMQMVTEPHPDVHIVTYGKNVHSETFEVTCRASLQPAVAAHLNHYMTVDWIGADGQIINEEHDDITVNDQSTVSNDVTRSLVFDPLKMAHGGSYVCRAKLTLPGSAGVFQNVGEYQLSVLNMTFIQLKFGPVPHCSTWYEDKHMSRHLELDVKQTLTNLINKNCSCDFKISEIDLGEFSCRSIEKGYVLYRARLTGRSDTQNIHSLLEVIKDWMANDGTFLYTYHGNMRLGLDQDCPLEIASFSQPEFGKQNTGPQ
ncbi:hypothetical protein GBAR_LOCUS13950 [Geodia barretti]|uniref:Ig-like domain-containing protein n=1 Tax=Geodia barretti TaxID=519541 RepID=A0AA35S654_GEOBA|nr:hypothetical protein GBAR_LOCUS13950 [Geodia barretti]